MVEATLGAAFERRLWASVSMSNRSQAIAGILAKAILDHRLVPGAKLGERELGEIFDVSRVMDESVFPQTSPVEALLPYLGKGKLAALDTATTQPRNVEEDGTAASARHRLEQQIRH
jgi:hypothetical protein